MSDLLPVLSPTTQAVIRMAYGWLLVGTILWTALPGRWFYRSTRWGGYGDRNTELLENPFAHTLLTGLWLVSAAMLIRGVDTVVFAAVNLGICWYYYVHTRWSSLLRGMGAPGFFCYWLAACVFCLEVGRYLDLNGWVLAATVLVFQVDYAVIQMCAGSYKSVCGYAGNAGMQLGLANPFWGRFWKLYRHTDPGHPIYRFLNQSAFRVQIAAGLLMLYPPTRWVGALAIALSFLFVMTQIRLAFLLPMVMTAGLLFVPAGSRFDLWLAQFVHQTQVHQSLPILPAWLAAGLTGFLLMYLVLLGPAKFCQWYNFIEGRPLARPWQAFLERWASAFGIIIWRVFSVDVIDFFVRVYIVDQHGQRDEYTGKVDARNLGRYLHVAESIALTSVFTAQKYHPRLFEEKLVRYARTVPCPAGGRVLFAHYTIDYSGQKFEFVHRADYTVEPVSGSVEATGEGATKAEVSPVRPSVRPGTYLPATGCR
ncbi:MAG: hypothetical protein AB7S38_35375 [Vulcanimicrobiota bacterium]